MTENITLAWNDLADKVLVPISFKLNTDEVEVVAAGFDSIKLTDTTGVLNLLCIVVKSVADWMEKPKENVRVQSAAVFPNNEQDSYHVRFRGCFLSLYGNWEMVYEVRGKS